MSRARGALLLVALGAACRAERPYPAPTAADLRAHVAHLVDAARTLRAELRVEYQASEGRVSATVMALAAEGRLRLDVLSPAGTTLQTLVVDGGRFELLDLEHERFETGDARACGVRVLPLPLDAGDASRVLRGGTPLLDGASEAAWDAWARAELLRVRAPDGRRQEVRLVGPRGRWRLARSEIRAAGGGSALLVEPIDGGLRIRSQTARQALDLRFRRVERNVELRGGAFDLAPPPGLPVEEAACGDGT